jgi:transposase
MRVVAVKTAEQQAAVLLHRGRERLVCQRTGLMNALRGHLAVAKPALELAREQ